METQQGKMARIVTRTAFDMLDAYTKVMEITHHGIVVMLMAKDDNTFTCELEAKIDTRLVECNASNAVDAINRAYSWFIQWRSEQKEGGR